MSRASMFQAALVSLLEAAQAKYSVRERQSGNVFRAAFASRPKRDEVGSIQYLVIARSQRVRPEVAGPMTGSATEQSRTPPPFPPPQAGEG
jgi:hypothetical protein